METLLCLFSRTLEIFSNNNPFYRQQTYYRVSRSTFLKFLNIFKINVFICRPARTFGTFARKLVVRAKISTFKVLRYVVYFLLIDVHGYRKVYAWTVW